jgi:TetR/AcrR family transcriptional regulator
VKIRPTKSRKIAHLTREKILAVSGRVFNRRGYYGTTLDDIGRALGVRKAALYYYVKSKEELLFQCHLLAVDLGMEALRRALAQPGAPDEHLRAALASYIEEMADQLKGTVAMLEDGALSPHLHARIVERRDEWERTLRQVIAEGVTAGIFVPCNPKIVAFAILGAIHSIPRWYRQGGPCSAKEIAETFSAYLVRGLQRRPSPESLSSPSVAHER